MRFPSRVLKQFGNQKETAMHRLRLPVALACLAMLLVFGFAQPASAQTCLQPNQSGPLCIFKNYFVTGDYVVGGWVKASSNGTLATGTINIPDCVQANKSIESTPCPTPPALPPPVVPAGADIVAAFLYWETVESSPPPFLGQNGFFNGFPIKGVILGNPNAPTSWSSGGCSGSSQGAKTIVGYRADVRPFLPVDANGNAQGNSPPNGFQVRLADSGSNGNTTPFTLGATLVIIYKVLASPAFPLNSIVLYDGAFAPNNQTAGSEMSQTMQGFYQAAVTTTRNSKLTHIVGDGQPNKGEGVSLNGVALPNLYPTLSTVAAFPGVYNGSWDNATWSFSNANGGNNPVGSGGASSATTLVTPTSSGSGCVDWGVVILSTTVEDPNHDGLLAAWKAANPPGYTDVISTQDGLSNPFVRLPGANPSGQDIFVEIDYLALRDAKGNILHSHLPKQLALDKVGDALMNCDSKGNCTGPQVHFDVGTNFNGVCKVTPPVGNQPACSPGVVDPYIIQGGTGGNEIPENAVGVVCTDGAALCEFPNQPAVGWKEGLLSVKNDPTLGNFQFGRKDSYHYVLFGHSLGTPRSFWTTFGTTLKSASVATLDSIKVSTSTSGRTATVQIESPVESLATPFVNPGDCSPNNAQPACTDANGDRVTVAGAMGHPALNGTYSPFTKTSQSTNGGVTTTTFTFTVNATTTAVPDGTYNYNNEPRLALEYGGPTSSSGHSDFRGGGDLAVMFGLWPADDPTTCVKDPSVSASASSYCVDQVGTITAEAGTLLHELGHTLTLTHGGQLFPNGTVVTSGNTAGQQVNSNPNSTPVGAPTIPTYGLNCNSGFLSSMNYLFQIRGFLPDVTLDGTHPIGYSGQTLPNLSEAALDEGAGIGLALVNGFFNGPSAPHFTRWYALPNALDQKIGRFATHHCDGSLIGPNEPKMVRVEGSTIPSPPPFGPTDWNNNLIAPDPTEPVAWQDVNFNGSTALSPDGPFQGFNDWVNIDLRQVGSRGSAFGLSGGGSQFDLPGGGSTGGGSQFDLPGGGSQFDLPGGGSQFDLPGGGSPGEANSGGATMDIPGGGSQFDLPGGGSQFDLPGGGAEQDQDAACSTADPPTGLSAQNSNKTVVLNWTAPGGSCQTRRYDVWKATGNFPTITSVLNAIAANPNLFTDITTGKNQITGAPPVTTFTDPNVKNGVTYTYFVTATNKQGATSGPSDPPAVITVKF